MPVVGISHLGRSAEYEFGLNLLTGMDQIHAAHGTAGIVEHPLVRVVVSVRVNVARVSLSKLAHDVIDDGAGVVAVGRNAALGELVQLVHLEDVEALEVALQQHDDGREDAEHDRDSGQETGQPAGF